jgi:DGQHR domain-containing protein
MTNGYDLVRMTSAGSVEISAERRARSVKSSEHVSLRLPEEEYDLFLDAGVWDKPPSVKKGINVVANRIGENTIEVVYNLSKWEEFESKVWNLFFEMGVGYLNSGKCMVLTKNQKHIKIDGVFTDTDYVYIARCFYSEEKKGIKADSELLEQQTMLWHQSWLDVVEVLSVRDEFQKKKFVPIVAHRGYKVTPQLKQKFERKGIKTLRENLIVDLRKLAASLGTTSKTIFKQELFRGEVLPRAVDPFNALMESIDGVRVFNFFANPDDIIDQAYVHRRLPDHADFSLAYQRMVKAEKISGIGSYLEQNGSFFPNSLVVAVDKVNFEPIDGNYGTLKLPNQYGVMWIIDGQHRLYGSAHSKNAKPISVCAIEGLDGLMQARHFTSINMEQTKVSPDLIWDLKGELYRNMGVPTNKKEETMMQEFVISNVWKNLNIDQNGPLGSRIVVPSQMKKGGLCRISFGTLCKSINHKTLWSSGALNRGGWDDCIEDVTEILNLFFSEMKANNYAEWNKVTKTRGEKNWLLSNYSIETFMRVFFWGITYFNATKEYQRKWNSDSEWEPLVRKLAEVLTKAIKSPDYGFHSQQKDILKAGSSGVRNDYAADLVLYIREEHSDIFSPEFATHIAHELSTSIDPSPRDESRIKFIEYHLRNVCFNHLYKIDPDQWYRKLPGDLRNSIKEKLKIESQWSNTSQLGDREKLNFTNFTDLNKVILSNYPSLNLRPKKSEWDVWFTYTSYIRNCVAHNRPYPDMQTKILWRAGMNKLYEAIMEMDPDLTEIPVILEE